MKSVSTEVALERYEKIRISMGKANKKYRDANKEKCNAKSKRYYDANKDDPAFKQRQLEKTLRSINKKKLIEIEILQNTQNI